ncbi:MAG: ABC transporter ATP-binding protein [Halobaculum sp.]
MWDRLVGSALDLGRSVESDGDDDSTGSADGDDDSTDSTDSDDFGESVDDSDDAPEPAVGGRVEFDVADHLPGAETAAETDASDLQAENLTVGYPGTEEPVIESESLVVPPGAVTALVGPNGSGKSTLLKTLAGQLDSTEGHVAIDGIDIDSVGQKELARRLGLLSQENTAPESIAVADLVMHGRYPHRGPFESPSEEDREAVGRALAQAGIEHLSDRELGTLSGGQRQLVWIAVTLAQETDVLLLDEPTTFLDLQHQLKVMEIVERLRDDEETTVVLVLHDVAQAAKYADYLVAMRDGTVYDWGPAEDVVTEDLLAEVFRIDATVKRTAGIEIHPHRPLPADGDGTAARQTETDERRSETDEGG